MILLARKMIFGSRPFAGRGASLYASVGSAPGVDPGPNSIVFRKLRILGNGRHLQGSGFSLGDGLVKTTRLDHVADPVTSFSYSVPAEWHDRIVWLQIRTHWDDCENPTNTDPYRLDLTDTGAEDPSIHGTGSILSLEKRDGGIYRFRINYTPANHGIQPTAIVIRKSAGTGTLADVEGEYFDGTFIYTIDSAELVDGEAYTFQALAQNGAVELLIDSITFTADNAGPPAAGGFTLSAI